MIRINNDYVIDVSDLEYTLQIDTHTTTYNKKSEKEYPVYKTVGHYTTLASALNGARLDMRRKMLADGEYTLKEAIDKVLELDDEFTRMMERIK